MAASPWDQEVLCNQGKLKSRKHGVRENETVGSSCSAKGAWCGEADPGKQHQRDAQPRRRFAVAKSSCPWILVRPAQAPLWTEEQTGGI